MRIGQNRLDEDPQDKYKRQYQKTLEGTAGTGAGWHVGC